MAKQKQKTIKVSVNVPEPWLNMIDERATREFVTRSQAIKYALRAYCFPRSKGKTIDNRPKSDEQKSME
jgi:metal-responsive CopG/Arc/MetJ family transcriptional regulator